MSKRGENIYRRRDGRWEGRIKRNDAVKGKYHSVYGKTYKELKEKMKEERQKIGQCRKDNMMSIDEAADIWISEKKDDWKQSTYAIYRQSLDKYIIPGFRDIPVCEINDQIVEEFFTSIKTSDKKLSNAYLSYLYGILKRVIQYSGKKSGKTICIPANPIAKARKKKSMVPDKNSLTRLEDYLIRNMEEDTSLGVFIALHTGLRIGELCALTWGDIDLDTGIIYVRRSIQRVKNFEGQRSKTELIVSTPKSENSIRDIPIPPVLLNILRIYRREASGQVVTGPKGELMDPRTLQYRFKVMLKKCNVEYFNFHMLRHAFATRCVELGFDAKTLSELLGHSHIQVTLGLYVHSTMQQKKQLMEMMAAYSGAEGIVEKK